MVVSGRGGGGGSGGGDGDGTAAGAGAAPPGTSPACGRAGRARPAAARVRAAAAGPSGSSQRGPGEPCSGSISGGSRAPAASQRSFSGQDGVAAEARGHSGKLMSRGRRLWPPAATRFAEEREQPSDELEVGQEPFTRPTTSPASTTRLGLPER
ncbi:glycine-rich protein 1-like [Passer domesticus]|uniref:glycine-rich protein 1-like n=1 Tax=Passer domesticus TaxID=48849 RepID=UPI0030FEE2F7